jgi:type II secretory ATPase GspE/PulE/Tfp pilus assembly ATPase PilB-like protein
MAEAHDLSLEEHLTNISQMPVVGSRAMNIHAINYLFDHSNILPYGYDRSTKSLIVAVNRDSNSYMELNDLLTRVPEFPQLITNEMRHDGVSEHNVQILYLEKDMMAQLRDFIIQPLKIEEYFARKKQLSNSEAGLYDEGSEANKIIDSIITYAIKNRASDIHFEAEGTKFRARVRVDGELREYPILIPEDKYPAVISSIKVRSQMDIAERRKPQDGRISVNPRILKEGKMSNYDLRVSVTPTVNDSENAVLRIAERGAFKTLDQLGFSPGVYEEVKTLCMEPYGLILVTGPTGSGKTTSLYGMLHQLNTLDRKIITIEDPVEIKMNGIEQLQIKESIGLDFIKYIRTVLRRDPDTILIGEIRDDETAKAAIDASKTGHLVFSTLHTNTSSGTLLRLMGMNIAYADLASNLQGILAQRLIGTFSDRIRLQLANGDLPKNIVNIDGGLELNKLIKEDYFKRGELLFKTDNNDETVYSGRTTITELWTITEDARDMISAGIMQGEKYFSVAVNNGMTPMLISALSKVKNGETSLDKIIREVGVKSFKSHKELIKKLFSEH